MGYSGALAQPRHPSHSGCFKTPCYCQHSPHAATVWGGNDTQAPYIVRSLLEKTPLFVRALLHTRLYTWDPTNRCHPIGVVIHTQVQTMNSLHVPPRVIGWNDNDKLIGRLLEGQ